MKMDFNWESVNGLARALGGRVELLEKVFKEKGLTPAMIQKIVASGFASDFFDIGDEIMTTYTATDGTEYDFPWRVVDFRDVYWENDPEPHPGMVLQAKYATAEKIPYDPAESHIVPISETEAEEGWYYFGLNGSSSYYAVELNLAPGDPIPHAEYQTIYKNDVNAKCSYDRGLSDWKVSSIRQWLNSDAEVGNWWVATHLGDVAPTQVDTYNGFMCGFESDFLDAINSTRIPSWTSIEFSDERESDVTYTYDKFFIPSAAELYAQYPSIEPGDTGAFEYWVKVIGTSKPDNRVYPSRIVCSLDNQSVGCICAGRSYMRTAPGSIIYLRADGTVNTLTGTSSARNVLPCCVIS